MYDLLTVFLQSVALYKFEEDLEGMKICFICEPFAPLYFEINDGVLVPTADLRQSDVTLKGELAQWSQFLLSSGKKRCIKVEGDASRLQLFQQQFEKILERYQMHIPSFLESLAYSTSSSVKSSLTQCYATKEDFSNFKKSIVSLTGAIDALEKRVKDCS